MAEPSGTIQSNTGTSSGPGHARLSYLPGLDGLRAIAVLGVLLYHADLAWAAGGYLGVQVFFVLSGYLITSLLLTEWRDHGRINLVAFWIRRARRLLPALFLVLFAVLTYAVLFLPEEVAGLRGDSLAAGGYVTNWYLIFTEKSYFEMVGRPPMLEHLWSLAVEEQFYLLWPVLFVAGLKRLRPRRGMLAAVAVGAAASALLMALLYQPDVDPSRVYYGTDTRAAGLLLGCALAFFWIPRRATGDVMRPRWGRIASVALDIGGLGALAALGWLFWRLDENQPFLYQGGFVVTSLVTLAAIATAIHPLSRLAPRLLGVGVLRWLGTRSYGIYLWHWPIFAVTRPQLDLPLDGAPLLALRFALTFALAELSYRFVETPVRSGALERAWRALRQSSGQRRLALAARWVAATGVGSLFAGALAVALVTAAPPAVPSYLQENAVDIGPTPATAALGDLPEPVITEYPPKEQLPPVAFDPGAGEQPVATSTPEPPALVVKTATALPTRAVASPTSIPQEPREPTAPPDEPRATHVAIVPSIPSATPEGKEAAGVTPEDPTPTGEPEISSASILGPPQAPPDTTPQGEEAKVGGAATTPEPQDALAVTSTQVISAGVVFAIGDSVMLGAAKDLAKRVEGMRVDAAVGRQASDGIKMLRAKIDGGWRADAVIVHLGNNGYFSAKEFDSMMSVLSDTSKVVFINDKVPRRWESPNNDAIAAGVARYPNAELIDWRAASANHSEYFYKDGIHLRPEGVKVYVALIVAALEKPEITPTPNPAQTVEATHTPETTTIPAPVPTEAPAYTPEPTATPHPIATPEPTETTEPVATYEVPTPQP